MLWPQRTALSLQQKLSYSTIYDMSGTQPEQEVPCSNQGVPPLTIPPRYPAPAPQSLLWDSPRVCTQVHVFICVLQIRPRDEAGHGEKCEKTNLVSTGAGVTSSPCSAADLGPVPRLQWLALNHPAACSDKEDHESSGEARG